MKRIIFLYFFLSLAPARSADNCIAPKVCNEIQTIFENLQNHQTKKKFIQFINLLKKASTKSCKIQGVDVLIPAYRICYDNGFTTKLNSAGELVIDRRFPGPLNEDAVLKWFTFAEISKFPEGKKFTRGKLFQSTLDGGWAELFSGK